MRVLVLAGLALFAALIAGSSVPANAQEKTPPNVEALINLLADPGVQKWLNEHKSPPSEASPAPKPQDARLFLSTALANVRTHVRGILAAVPGLPSEFARARATLSAEEARLGPLGPIELVVLATALAALLSWLYIRTIRSLGDRLVAVPPTTVRERLMAVVGLFALDAGNALAIAAGCVIALLVLEWPPLPKDLVLTALLAWASFSLVWAALRAVLSPPGTRKAADPDAFRLLPLSDERAAFWYMWLGRVAALLIFGYAAVVILNLLGFTLEGRQLVAYTLGLWLLATGAIIVWTLPRTVDADPGRRIGPNVVAGFLSASFALLWLLWAAGAMKLFWLVAVVLLLPTTIRLSRRMVAHALRPIASDDVQRASVPSIAAVCVDRGIRVALIVATVLLLAWAWSIDLVDLTASDTLTTRMLRGVMSAVVILLVADFTWQIARTLLDMQISAVQELGEPGTPEAHRRARMRTLLPIFRNVLFAVLAVVAILMALASLGVEIGPLVAGAGVVGVAVGFGAQTLVKDVISGMFYLLDDAFRVGEYIESGRFKGTVESFSIRSVKLRHQRGPIFTVPFGELGAIQNMSRDWVVEKIMLNITYDSDVEKARKIIKKIGLELAEDPEFKNSTIDPLKMQGVDNFGDYAIQIRLKLKTKPGEQFNIKRRAFMMIKQAFEENGIKFARPVVQVASGASAEEAAAAASHEAMEKRKRDLAPAS